MKWLKKITLSSFFILSGLYLSPVMACDNGSHNSDKMMMQNHNTHHMTSYGNVPVGLMANMHHEGFMFSIKQGYMDMRGNILDGSRISNEEILALPNKTGSQPKNLSVVPTDMKMQMTMISLMYAPMERINFMAMATYTSKDMKLNSYKPMMDRGLLGTFSTSTNDLSNYSLSGLFKLKEDHRSRWHMEICLQNSAGSNDSTDTVLTPMGTSSKMILPYGMQSGDGSKRLVLGITNVKKHKEKIVWGNQIKRKLAFSSGDWNFGDELEYNTWIQYELNKSVSLSTRMKFIYQDEISGKSTLINAPVQTANPENYGGKELHLGLGVSFWPNQAAKKGNRLGLEIVKPVVQNKNNLQMKTNYQIILAYQKSL